MGLGGLLAIMTVPQYKRYESMNPPLLESDESPYTIGLKEYPNGDFQVFSVADTGSMHPTLAGSDYLLAQKVKYDDLKEGEIVIYNPKWNNGKSTVHRLVQKDKGGWIMSGDNNKRSESWERMTPETYTAKAIKIIRKPKKEK